VEEYASGYYQSDIIIAYAARNTDAGLCDVSAVLSQEQIAASDYMRWYIDRFKSPYFVVGYSPPDDGLTFGISAHPGYRDRPFHLTLFDLISRHVRRSVALAARPPQLDDRNVALIVVRSSGKVVAMSALAERYLSANDGLGLADGCVVAAWSSDSQCISRAVRAAATPAQSGSAGTALLVKRPSRRRDWLLSVTPFETSKTALGAFQPKAMIRIVDPNRTRSLSAAICNQFKLTEREAQVATLLLNGHSSSSAARCLEISENTAKVHLQAIYRKTQTNRQAELVKLLLEVS
jgi:DNA-binding CsgD family transcriptional regulator